jgi:hypothetical protein
MKPVILFRPCLFLLVALLAVSCGRTGVSGPPQIQLNAQLNSVDVTGLPAETMTALAAWDPASGDWPSLLRISVKTSGEQAHAATGGHAVAGKYAVVGTAVRFTPLFPFDEGRQYDVVLDPSKLPGEGDELWRTEVVTAVVGRPAVARSPSTVVSHMYPSGETVPANQLRLYLHFSAPMDWRSGHDHLVLLDERGEEVVDAFLPLDADFWNDDRTRYTVFFDPGRVKRGILPNRQMGRALEAGKRYTLLVKRDWRDGHGQPLREDFRREFSVVPAVERALTMRDWKIGAPPAGTREPLVVSFPQALDQGLLRRALGVARGGKPIDGSISIEAAETRWSFTPGAAWVPGEYELVALEFLEDLAGNRIGRAFEVDNFERTDITSEPERSTLAFRVAGLDERK